MQSFEVICAQLPHPLVHSGGCKHNLPRLFSQVLVKQVADVLFVARVHESVELINHQALKFREVDFITISSMLESVESADKAVDALFEFFCFNLVVLAWVYAKVAQRDFILERL